MKRQMSGGSARIDAARLQKAAEAALWLDNLRRTSNAAFVPLYFDRHRYLVLKGGGGSGKSIFAGRKVLERVISEPGHRWLVLRKVGKTLRNSCFAQLLGQLREHYPAVRYRVNKTDMEISFMHNGSKIIFSGLDDVEKLKSIYDITGIWIEEASELLESDFNQLDIRLRTAFPYYLQIIITFNPVSITHWLKRRFFDQVDPRVRIHESTYKDNRYLPQEAIDVLEAFRKSDEYYYMVYALGEWGVTGKTVFSAKAVTAQLLKRIKPVERGLFAFDDDGLKLKDIELVCDDGGYIKIYRPPETGVPYVIGADTAGDGSDYFVAQVLDNRSGAQVCVMRLSTDEDIFAKQLYCLGKYYNWALIGVETNFSTFPVRELERLRYPKQYVRETVDDYTHRPKKSYGYTTNTKTRPVAIAGLVAVVREDPTLIVDETTLEEMLTFVRNPDTLKPEAEYGANDDCVMALAIAHAIRGQQSYFEAADDTADASQWTKDMWEDYRRASTEERAVLRRIWGRPKK